MTDDQRQKGELRCFPELPPEKVCGGRHPSEPRRTCTKVAGHQIGVGWSLCSDGHETWLAR